ncbi:hypothetical protein OROHE_005821 [Orobanche hederae]
MSCPKKNFCLSFVYLHNFCCRIVENRTGAFDSCSNLRYRMMIAILYGERVNWCQFLLNRLGEEVSKPLSQKKSFGLFLNNLLFDCGVNLSPNAKKIGPGKYLGGSKPTPYCHAGPIANRPFIRIMPNAQHPRRSFGKSSVADDLSKKRKRSVSDSMSPLTAKKKPKKDSKSKSAGTVTNPVTIDDHPSAQVADPSSQGASFATTSSTPLPTATLSDQQIFANLENLDSSIQIDSSITSPVRIPIPNQDPTHYRAPSPVCDPSHNGSPTPVCDPLLNRNPSPVRDLSPNRVPTPVRDPSPIQASIPVEDPIPIENPIPVRSPSPPYKPFNPRIEEAFQRFKQWKSYRTGPYEALFNWKEWKQEEEFNLEITDAKDVQPLIQWEDQCCHELIYSHFLYREDKGKSTVPDQTASDVIPEQPQSSKSATRHPGASTSKAPTPVIRPESQAEAKTEHLEDLSRQTVFLTNIVDALYKVGKEMNWLNLSAKEESASI